MVNLQTNALIYTITAKQNDNGKYIGDDKLSENVSALYGRMLYLVVAIKW